MNEFHLAGHLAWIAVPTLMLAGTAGASPATLLAYYPFEEGRGDVTADAAGGNGSASLIGDVAFKAEGKHGLGLEFSGFSDWVDTGRSILDTSQSYSVAAWILLADDFADDFRTVVSQDDEKVSGFYLQYALGGTGPGSDALRINRWANPAGGEIFPAHTPGRPASGRWIHLCGVQDVDRHRLLLFVDGRLISDRLYNATAGAFEWRANGNTIIGRGKFNAGPVDLFLGRIDEVYFFRGVVTPDEVTRIMNDRYLPSPLVRGKPQQISNTQQIAINAEKPGAIISPLLFGHNLEHTRRAVWQGLSAELLANRRFMGRAGADGALPHWLAVGGLPAQLMADPKVTLGSGQSQRISIQAAGKVAGVGQGEIPLKAAMEYVGRFWLKANRAMLVTLKIQGQHGKAYATQTLSLKSVDWQEWNSSFKAPQDDRNAKLEITFEGPGMLWVGAASLMPADHFRGMRRDVVELLKRLSPSVLRWPGGNFTRDCRWRDGLTSIDRRVPTRTSFPEVLPFTDNYDFHEIGTDEFIDLCRHVGAEPAITVSVDPVVSPPAYAAGWVEYCNGSTETPGGRLRASRGHREPYRVKYWSIGNEVWGAWMGQSHCDAGTYAKRIREYATAMKHVDPSIVLIVSGQPGDWDRTILAGAGSAFDLLSEHHYAPVVQAVSGPRARREFMRLAKMPAGEVFGMLRGTHDAIKKSDGSRIGIAFDEWNIWHDWFAKPFQNEWHVGPIDGIYAAAMLNMLCRESGNLGLSMACYFQPVNEGLIAVQPFSSHLTAAGQAFTLLGAHRGNRLVPVTLPRPTCGLDACASASTDGRRLVLVIVNRNLARPREIELSLAGAHIGPEPSARFLTFKELEPDAVFAEKAETLAERRGDHPVLVLPGGAIVLVELRLMR